MTTIDIKWSALAAQLHAPGPSRLESALDNAIDSLLPGDQDMELASYHFGGTALTVNLGNGAVLAVGGLGLGSSVITADSLRLYRDGTASIELPGRYTIHYTLANGTPQILGVDGQVFGMSVATAWQPGSANYDPAIGNVSVNVTGALTLDDGLSVHGQLSRVDFSTSSGAVRGSVEGSFSVSGQGQASGALTGANIDYADGSFLRIGGARIDASNLTLSDAAAVLGNAANFVGDDVFNLDVAASGVLPMINTGDGNDRITLAGGANYMVAAGAGDDVITVLAGKNSIQGGAGFDTAVIAGKRADFHTEKAGSWHVAIRPDGGYNAGLQSVERVLFDDSAVAFDIDGHAGQAYRLYAAALGRAPEAEGMGYWISMLDRGASLHDVASGFMASPEFKLLVGADANDTTFVTKLYNNVLHRAPEAEGLAYWEDVLAGGASRASVLVGFSESPENQAQVIGSIQDGIDFLPHA